MKNKKKRMYLSLPISGRKIEKVKEYAKKMKEIWEGMGYDVVTPFEINPDPDMAYSQCMGRCVAELLECDGIILCHDWFQSKGCRTECHVAQVYGKTIRVEQTPYL